MSSYLLLSWVLLSFASLGLSLELEAYPANNFPSSFLIAPAIRAYMDGRNGTALHQPVDALKYPRFTGIRTFARLPHITSNLDSVDVAVVGLPFDTGATFKAGARFGPESVRSASAILRPHNHEQDVTTLEVLSVIDYGDSPIAPGFIEHSYDLMVETLKPLAGIRVNPPFCSHRREVLERWVSRVNQS